MKFYVEYYTWNRAGTKTHGWGIVEFAFRNEITADSIRIQLVEEWENKLHVMQMIKL